MSAVTVKSNTRMAVFATPCTDVGGRRFGAQGIFFVHGTFFLGPVFNVALSHLEVFPYYTAPFVAVRCQVFPGLDVDVDSLHVALAYILVT